MRLFRAGAVSPDGHEALVPGIPVDCSATSMNDCPFPMWRLSIERDREARPRRHRHGRELSTPITCQTGVSRSRRRREAATKGRTAAATTSSSSQRTISRRRGRSCAKTATARPSYSVGGLLAYLVYDAPDTHCTKLPCDTADLFVAPAGASAGAARLLARAQVSMLNPNAFSSDGKYLVYGSKTDLFVCSVDDAHCDKLGTGWFAGWVR